MRPLSIWSVPAKSSLKTWEFGVLGPHCAVALSGCAESNSMVPPPTIWFDHVPLPPGTAVA